MHLSLFSLLITFIDAYNVISRITCLLIEIICFHFIGTLLLDEVAWSEAVKLNQRTMQLDGFVDLGSYTPEGALNTRADHALVFMFQTFQGNWVQVIACFLSRSATVSDILHKLMIECIILLENAGYKVGAATCDGAQ